MLGLPDRDALRLGIAAGAVAAGVSAAAAWLRMPPWARLPEIAPFEHGLAIRGGRDRPDHRLPDAPGGAPRDADGHRSGDVGLDTLAHACVAALALVGLLAAGVPAGSHYGGWLAAGCVTATGWSVAYVTLVRFDLRMVPVVLGTMAAVGALARGAQRPFPGALAGSVVAAAVILLVGWWWSRALGRPPRRDNGTPEGLRYFSAAQTLAVFPAFRHARRRCVRL